MRFIPGGKPVFHRPVFTLAIFGLGCVCLLAGCGESSTSAYHASPRVGKDSDTLDPAAKASDQTAADSKSTASAIATNDKASEVVAPAPETAQAQSAEELPRSQGGLLPADGSDKARVSERIASALKGDQLAVVAPRPETSGTSAGPLQLPGSIDPAPRKPEVLVKERKFNVEGPEGAIRLSYDDIDLLRVLNMEPVTPDALTLMPDWLKSLDGKRVRLRGFMFPPYSQTDLSGFAFARDNQICCFVKKPKWYDVFGVHLRDGELTDYIEGRPFDVVGVFHLVRDPEEWPIGGMYRIDDARVIDR